MTILTGFLFALSAQSLNPRPTAAASVKDELVSRIESLQAQGHAQEDRVAALTKEVGDLEALALRQAGAADLKQLGAVMKLLSPRVKGVADGRLVNEVVRELLSR